MKHALPYLFLLCSLSAFAQTKSAQVAEYLGADRYESIPVGPDGKPFIGPVTFHFLMGHNDLFLKRNSDGQKTYSAILRNVTGYTDDGGKLLGISTQGADGKVRTIDPVQRVASASVPAESAQPIPGEKPGWSMPDSVETARQVDAAKRTIDDIANGAGKIAAPWWEVYMYGLIKITIILLLVAGLLRLIARTAAGETRVGLFGAPIFGAWLIPIHQWCCFGLLIIAWVLVGSNLVNVYFWINAMKLPFWVTIFLWFVILRFSERFINWIVPDVPVVGGGGFRNGGGNPGLNSGR